MSEVEGMTRVHIRVTGRVQGVGFRFSCMREARALEVAGWVCNSVDGSVEIMAEGGVGAVDALVEWARCGPTFADVTGTQIHRDGFRGEFSGFEVR